MLNRKISITFDTKNDRRLKYFIKNLIVIIDDFKTKHPKNAIRSRFDLVVENEITESYTLLSKDCLQFYETGFFNLGDRATIEITLQGVDGRYLLRPLRELITRSLDDSNFRTTKSNGVEQTM